MVISAPLTGTHLRASRSVEELLSIDIRLWHRARLLSAESQFNWCWHIGSRRVAWLHAVPRAKRLDLWYRNLTSRDAILQQAIPLTYTPCHFGGHRPWFRCPTCSCRAAVLYLAGHWICRHCCNARYPSQSEDRSTRALRHAARLRVILGLSITTPLQWAARPSGMHVRRFRRLLDQIAAAERKAIEQPPGWLVRLEEKLEGDA